MPKGVPNKRYIPEFKKLVVETMQKEKEHFKQELIEYLDYYNNRRIKAKAKGLAACNSQTTSPFGSLNNLR